MKFAFQIVSVLPLATLVFGEEDGFVSVPDVDACGVARCVPIYAKTSSVDGEPYEENDTNSQTLVETTPGTNEYTFDYDDYFDFPDYGVMCHTCYTTLPGTTIIKGDQPVGSTDDIYVDSQYVADDLNCRQLSAVTTNAEMEFTNDDGESLVLENIPEFRMMPASFWQDTDTSADYTASTDIPDKYYMENYCINNFRDFIDPCCEYSESPSLSPSKAPSSAPSSAPTTSKPKDDPCFSSMSTVYVQEKGQTSMANVEVGDVVLTMNGFEKIYTIDHRNENEATDFVQIVTETDNAIELTSKHLIYLHDRHDPVEAGTVEVGDKLLTGTSDAAEVSKVSIVTRNGLFNPITSSGTIVVDGIATSTYTAIDVTGGSSYITIGGYKILSMHDFMHLAMGPFKVLCLNVPEAISSGFCLIEGGEEHNVYNKIGLQLLSFGKNQNIHVQSAIVLSLVTLFVGVNLFFNPIFVMISLIYTVKTFQKSKNL